MTQSLTVALLCVHHLECCRAKEGEALKAAREAEEANWPSCNSKWTQDEGEQQQQQLAQQQLASSVCSIL
jgi:hypothetical protein